MKSALAGRASVPFAVPTVSCSSTSMRETGKLPTPLCPKVISESFIAGTQPTEVCELHRFIAGWSREGGCLDPAILGQSF